MINKLSIELQHENNGTYQGFINAQKQKDIFGVFLWDSGDFYIGEWKDNQIHGQGVIYFSTGGYFEGFFKDSEASDISLLVFPNDDKYFANWKKGNLDGKVQMLFKGKQKFFTVSYTDGTFLKIDLIKENVKEVKDINDFIQKFNIRKLIQKYQITSTNSNIQYETGNIESIQNEQLNFSKINFQDGGFFIGVTENNIPHGLGLFYYSDQKFDCGLYKNGFLNGIGHKILPNGNAYDGSFVQGKFEGDGIIYNKCQNQYSFGQFKENLIIDEKQKGEGFPRHILNQIKQQIHENGQNYTGMNVSQGQIKLSLQHNTQFLENISKQGQIDVLKLNCNSYQLQQQQLLFQSKTLSRTKSNTQKNHQKNLDTIYYLNQSNSQQNQVNQQEISQEIVNQKKIAHRKNQISLDILKVGVDYGLNNIQKIKSEYRIFSNENQNSFNYSQPNLHNKVKNEKQDKEIEAFKLKNSNSNTRKQSTYLSPATRNMNTLNLQLSPHQLINKIKTLTSVSQERNLNYQIKVVEFFSTKNKVEENNINNQNVKNSHQTQIDNPSPITKSQKTVNKQFTVIKAITSSQANNVKSKQGNNNLLKKEFKRNLQPTTLTGQKSESSINRISSPDTVSNRQQYYSSKNILKESQTTPNDGDSKIRVNKISAQQIGEASVDRVYLINVSADIEHNTTNFENDILLNNIKRGSELISQSKYKNKNSTPKCMIKKNKLLGIKQFKEESYLTKNNIISKQYNSNNSQKSSENIRLSFSNEIDINNFCQNLTCKQAPVEINVKEDASKNKQSAVLSTKSSSTIGSSENYSTTITRQQRFQNTSQGMKKQQQSNKSNNNETQYYLIEKIINKQNSSANPKIQLQTQCKTTLLSDSDCSFQEKGQSEITQSLDKDQQSQQNKQVQCFKNVGIQYLHFEDQNKSNKNQEQQNAEQEILKIQNQSIQNNLVKGNNDMKIKNLIKVNNEFIIKNEQEKNQQTNQNNLLPGRNDLIGKNKITTRNHNIGKSDIIGKNEKSQIKSNNQLLYNNENQNYLNKQNRVSESSELNIISTSEKNNSEQITSQIGVKLKNEQKQEGINVNKCLNLFEQNSLRNLISDQVKNINYQQKNESSSKQKHSIKPFIFQCNQIKKDLVSNENMSQNPINQTKTQPSKKNSSLSSTAIEAEVQVSQNNNSNKIELSQNQTQQLTNHQSIIASKVKLIGYSSILESLNQQNIKQKNDINPEQNQNYQKQILQDYKSQIDVCKNQLQQKENIRTMNQKISSYLSFQEKINSVRQSILKKDRNASKSLTSIKSLSRNSSSIVEKNQTSEEIVNLMNTFSTENITNKEQQQQKESNQTQEQINLSSVQNKIDIQKPVINITNNETIFQEILNENVTNCNQFIEIQDKYKEFNKISQNQNQDESQLNKLSEAQIVNDQQLDQIQTFICNNDSNESISNKQSDEIKSEQKQEGVIYSHQQLEQQSIQETNQYIKKEYVNDCSEVIIEKQIQLEIITDKIENLNQIIQIQSSDKNDYQENSCELKQSKEQLINPIACFNEFSDLNQNVPLFSEAIKIEEGENESINKNDKACLLFKELNESNVSKYDNNNDDTNVLLIEQKHFNEDFFSMIEYDEVFSQNSESYCQLSPTKQNLINNVKYQQNIESYPNSFKMLDNKKQSELDNDDDLKIVFDCQITLENLTIFEQFQPNINQTVNTNIQVNSNNTKTIQPNEILEDIRDISPIQNKDNKDEDPTQMNQMITEFYFNEDTLQQERIPNLNVVNKHLNQQKNDPIQYQKYRPILESIQENDYEDQHISPFKQDFSSNLQIHSNQEDLI